MNLFLFFEEELQENFEIIVSDERAKHLREVLKVQPEQQIAAGMINAEIGIATVLAVKTNQIVLQWKANSAPPSPIDCIVVLALPRPKMMRRVIQNLASMGVKEIHLINSWKVEKSYWQSPWLKEEALCTELKLGLAQCIDTLLPNIYLHRLFKPFAEDVLPTLCENRKGLIAHPYNAEKCPIDIKTPSTLAIGPEGGFTDYEVDLMCKAGLKPVSIGPRILRVETAVPAILGRLYPN